MSAVVTVFWDVVAVLAMAGVAQLLCGHHRTH